MEVHEIETKVREIIVRVIGTDKVIDNLALVNDLSSIVTNSIRFIKIVVAIEEEFGIEFDDEKLDFNKFSNLKTLALYIKSKINC